LISGSPSFLHGNPELQVRPVFAGPRKGKQWLQLAQKSSFFGLIGNPLLIIIANRNCNPQGIETI